MIVISFILLFIINNTIVSSLQCYKLVPNNSQGFTIVKVDLSSTACPTNSCACVSYLVPCSIDNTICTPDEQKYGLWKWMHTVVAASSCQSLQDAYSKIYMDFFRQCNMTAFTIEPYLPTIGVYMPTIPFHVPSVYPTRIPTFQFTVPTLNQTITSPNWTVPTLNFTLNINISFTKPYIPTVNIQLPTITPPHIPTVEYNVPTFQVHIPTFQPQIPTVQIQLPNISITVPKPIIPFFTPVLQFNITTVPPINIPTFYTQLPTLTIPRQDPCSAYATLQVDCCLTNLCNIAGLTLDQMMQATLIQYSDSGFAPIPSKKRRHVST